MLVVGEKFNKDVTKGVIACSTTTATKEGMPLAVTNEKPRSHLLIDREESMVKGLCVVASLTPTRMARTNWRESLGINPRGCR
jgi:hypothetical protein